MLRAVSILTLSGVSLALSVPGLAKRPTTVTKVSTHFKLEKLIEAGPLRTRQETEQLYREAKAEATQLVNALEPRIKAALRTLSRRHRTVFTFGRYREKNHRAREGDNNQIELSTWTGKRLPRTAPGPFNYHVGVFEACVVELTFSKVPSAKWRKFLIKTIRKVVEKTANSMQ